MAKFEEIKLRLNSIEILKFLARNYKQKELEKIFKLPSPILSRYINGKVLPSRRRAEKIIEIFEKNILKKFIEENIKVVGEKKIFDHSDLISNIEILNILSKIVHSKFSKYKPTRILTKETMGVPFATLVSREFSVPLAISREKKEIGIEKFFEGKRIFQDGTYTFLYLPRKLIKKNDRVLIVDDSVRTGSSLNALIDICEKAGAKVVGAVFIIAIKESFENLKEKYKNIYLYSFISL